MAIATQPEYAKLDELFLDPLNPRLGRDNTGANVKQERILQIMEDWKLDELAVSFLESKGFWSYEALLVIEEPLYGKTRLVVLEGNRRLAALMMLKNTYAGKVDDRKWREIASTPAPANLFTKIPYLLVDDRLDVEAFLGFRHVTGIEEWRPAEKAEYISKMIERGMSYREVTRKIGSKINTVRQNYVAYRLLLEMDKRTDVPAANFEDRFSVMYLTLRSEGVQRYLSIDVMGEPQDIRRQIPKVHTEALRNFAMWLFGDETTPPLFTDSRNSDKFGQVLESKAARDYLERNKNPSLEVAVRLSGGDEKEIVQLVGQAADNVELCLGRAHHYPKSKELVFAVERLARDVRQLLAVFPALKMDICKNPE